MKNLALSTNHWVGLIEANPLDLAAWADLAQSLSAQNDQLSAQSVAVISDGLQALSDNSIVNGALVPPPAAAKTLFIRLARAYNDHLLFREVGERFLCDWGLPAAACPFFLRAIVLGGCQTQIDGLLQQAFERKIETEPRVVNAPAPTAVPAPAAPPPAPKTAPRRIVLGVEVEKKAKPASALSCLQLAQEASSQNKLDVARGWLEKAAQLQAEPRPLSEAWSAYGLAGHRTGNLAEMERGYAEARRLDPSNLVTHFHLGLAYHLARQPEKALHCCRQLLDPKLSLD